MHQDHGPHSKKDVDTLNHLLRGEIAAVETYDQAIKKFSDPADRSVANALTRIRDEHARTVSTLKSRVTAAGGSPSEGAGAWGVFANAVQGAAKVLGPETALAALKQGELHGIDDYEKAIKDDDVSSETRSLFSSQLLPPCREHVRQLDGMMSQVEAKKS